VTRSIYTLIIVVAVGAACGRIFCAQLVLEPGQHRDETEPPGKRLWPKKVPKPMPTFSSNDRSRWATVRALVENGTYVVGQRDPAMYRASAIALVGQLDPMRVGAVAHAGFQARVGSSTGIIFEDGFQSVDKVLRPETLAFYSSKPPLLTTLVAGLYWLLHALFGWTLSTYPNAVVRTILILVNVVPFALYLHVLAGWLERWSAEPWARLFVFVSAAFATLVSPFLITLNNHTLATFAVLFALHGVVRIWEAKQAEDAWESQRWRHGPHGYWFAITGVCASFAATMEMPALALAACVAVLLLAWYPIWTLGLFVPAAAVPVAAFFLTNQLAVGQWRPVQSEFDGAATWYQYEGSHWRKPIEGEIRTGIDWARQHESRAWYAFHVLLGHHGWFSLTPIWLLALWGMVRGSLAIRAAFPWEPRRLPWFIPPMALLVNAVVIGFYLWKTDNYGGFTVGLRWLMWLTPLWLVCMIPTADRLAASPVGRRFAYVLLALSVVSANYSPWNPWRHPWLYDFMMALGWQGY
jgi:hypothetical protein